MFPMRCKSAPLCEGYGDLLEVSGFSERKTKMPELEQRTNGCTFTTRIFSKRFLDGTEGLVAH